MPPEFKIIEQTFICLVCHQLFYSKLDLVKHFRSSHGVESHFLRRDDDDNIEDEAEGDEFEVEDEEERCNENEHKVVDVFWPRFW